jgi:hypothetical protein
MFCCVTQQHDNDDSDNIVVDLIKSMIEAVNKLSEDVTQVKNDNTALKIQVQDLQGLVDVHTKLPRSSHRVHCPPGLVLSPTRKLCICVMWLLSRNPVEAMLMWFIY